MFGIWLVGKYTADSWEINGAYLTRRAAMKSMREGEFVGWLPLGRAPDEQVTLPRIVWAGDD